MMSSIGNMRIGQTRYVVRVILMMDGKRQTWYLSERLGYMLRTDQNAGKAYDRDTASDKARDAERWYHSLGFQGATAEVIPMGWAHL